VEIKREKAVSSVAIEVAYAAVVFMVAGAIACSGNSPGPRSGPDGGAGQGGAAGAAAVSCAGGTAGGFAVGGAGGTSVGGAGGASGGLGLGGAAGTSVGGAGGAGGQAQPGCSIPSAPPGTWVEIPEPTGQDLFHVTDAFAVGTDDLLFAGDTYDPTTGSTTNSRLLRWTQGCWTVELAIPSSSASSVHGTGPSDLWATGGDLLYHRDAQGWTAFADNTWRSTAKQPASTEPIEFHRVRAAAANDVWIAASSNVLHWSGESWTTYNFDDPNYPNVSASLAYDFNDIWIDSTSNVWVVGSSAQVGNTMSDGFVHHFDGASWTHTGVGVYSIYAIWRGGAVLWLAQPTRELVNGQGQFLTLRAFDGTSAPAVEITGVDPAQNAVSLTNLFGRGANDVWAAGQDVAHFDGQSWSLVTDAPAAARNADATATFVTGDAGAIWLATPGPRFFRKATSP
jgi:hypothetical protein